jgi:hypothetical protein
MERLTHEMRQPFIDSAGQNPAGAKAVKAAEITFGRKKL